ncbi:MAG: sodium/proline symporter [Candidatus Zixiibacteriota bacterium]|nr:MAG: sodium/proline symporter [candidate division Zixibacteria bacterium]
MESSWILAISFIVYTGGIIATGLWSARRRRRTTDDFVLANRELGPWVSALSASASAESGWVMLGLVGTAFVDGMAAFWIVPGIGIGYLFNWFVLAERLRKNSREGEAATLPQVICGLFGRGSAVLRYIPVVIITAAMLGYVAAQMNAAGKAFEAVFALPYWVGVLVGAAIILAYTITGGFRAICWTDVVQASFMMIALIGMPILIGIKLGGFGAVSSALEASSPELLTFSGGRVGYALLGYVIGMMGIGLGYPGQPHILSRFMAAKDSSTVSKGGWIAFGWFILVYVGAIFFGLFARVYFGMIGDPEQALPMAVGELLPPVLGGFVIAAIVSAICSTADSQLIVMSSTISRDILGHGKASGSWTRFQTTDRVTLVVLALISILLAVSENRVIFWMVLYAWGVLGAAFGPVLILGLMWKRTTKAGALAGMITGSLVAVIWKEVEVLSSAVYELVPAFILAFAATILVSLLTNKTEGSPDP